MARPPLTKNMDPAQFDAYYWYLNELQTFAVELGLPRSGGKFLLHDRISHFLRTGEILTIKETKPNSNFDWKTEVLDRNTVISDSYRNTQNVRRFFIDHLGTGFKFSITFMEWMKAHIGYTLGYAIDHWPEIKDLRKNAFTSTAKQVFRGTLKKMLIQSGRRSSKFLVQAARAGE